VLNISSFNKEIDLLFSIVSRSLLDEVATIRCSAMRKSLAKPRKAHKILGHFGLLNSKKRALGFQNRL